MNCEDSIRAKKASSLKESFDKEISILDNRRNIIGSLVPVGPWLLNDIEILDKIVGWRSKFNRMFPTRKSVDKLTTSNFIKQSYINNPSAILFLIYTYNKELVGHIGLSKLDQKSFELVNLIRGASGGSDQLIYYAEISLLNFGFGISAKSEAFLELMSYNWVVKDLHERVGFTRVTSYPLEKVVALNGISHITASEEQKNVEYTIDIFSLPRDRFYSLHRMQEK